MSITTRTGDRGTTRLFSGEEVAKCSARPAAYGELDELVSVLGIARCHCRRRGDDVLTLQRELFVVGAELATTAEGRERLRERVDQASLSALEARMTALESAIPMPTDFIVPGSNLAAAHLDHARTVARRCERHAVGLHRGGELDNEILLVWLNRLSDYLWLLARAEEDEPTRLRP